YGSRRTAMWRNLRTSVCWALLCLGLGVMPSNAAETRIITFAFPCDGNQQFVNVTLSGLGNSVNRFIQGAEISLFQKDGALRYVVLAANSDPQKILATLSTNSTRVSHDYIFSLVLVPTSASGTVPLLVNGICSGGGQVQGIALVTFFS